MEVSSLNGLQYDEDKALNSLLDAFGSVFSLNDIASAYCEAGRNPDLAGQILYEMQEMPSLVNIDQSNSKVKNDESLESSCGSSLQICCKANGDLQAPKQKARSISGGAVSSMIGKGKGYMKAVALPNGSYPGTKPMKLDSKEMSMSLFLGEGLESSSRNEDHLHKDMEDFLFKMLGQGFRLQRDVIREVLVSCGYNMQKSMENLLERSAAGSDKDNKSLVESKKTNDVNPRVECSSQENTNRFLNANVGERQQKNRNYLEEEVLTALFDGPEKYEELPRREMRSAKRPIALGEIMEGPLIDVTAKPKVNRVHTQEDKKDDEDGEDSFQALRRVVKEYRGTMKEYYKDAVDAFAKGYEEQANRLLEQGQVFREKARQADEESNQKIFLTGNTETENEMLLELHDHGPKEAIQLLKCHLTSLAGIPSFKYLKVIVDTNEQDSSKGTRRRMIMKLLKRESISWNEGESSGILLIRLDNLDPKSLSFAKK